MSTTRSLYDKRPSVYLSYHVKDIFNFQTNDSGFCLRRRWHGLWTRLDAPTHWYQSFRGQSGHFWPAQRSNVVCSVWRHPTVVTFITMALLTMGTVCSWTDIIYYDANALLNWAWMINYIHCFLWSVGVIYVDVSILHILYSIGQCRMIIVVF